MKKVTFKKTNKKEFTLEDLRNTVVEFLNSNGMKYAEDRVKINHEKIHGIINISLKFNNSKYTQAIGVFSLLFTEDNPYAFLNFENNECTIIMREHFQECINELIQYIKNRSEVKIEL